MKMSFPSSPTGTTVATPTRDVFEEVLTATSPCVSPTFFLRVDGSEAMKSSSSASTGEVLPDEVAEG